MEKKAENWKCQKQTNQKIKIKESRKFKKAEKYRKPEKQKKGEISKTRGEN